MMFYKHYKISIVFEKDDLDSDIVNVLIFSFPCLNRLRLKYLNCFLRVIPYKSRNDQFHGLFTGYKLPQTIRSNDYEFVI